jgi:alkylhydroperoxidase family enzyme
MFSARFSNAYQNRMLRQADSNICDRDSSTQESNVYSLGREIMEALQPVDVAAATGEAKETFDGIQQRLGAVPNLLRLLGHSPTILRSYLAFNNAFNGDVSEQLLTLIRVTVAQIAGADYLLSFGHVLGKRAGLNDEQVKAARRGESSDVKTAAVLRFAAKAAREHGRLSEDDLAAVRDAGYTEAELAAIVGYVSLSMFRTYYTLMSQIDIDYPVVKSADLAATQNGAA